MKTTTFFAYMTLLALVSLGIVIMIMGISSDLAKINKKDGSIAQIKSDLRFIDSVQKRMLYRLQGDSGVIGFKDTPVAGSGIEVEMLTDSTFSYRLIDMPGRMPSLWWPIGDTIPRKKIDTSKLPHFDTIAKNGLTKSDTIIKMGWKLTARGMGVGFTVVKPNGKRYTIMVPVTEDNKEEATYLEWPGGSRKCTGTRDMIRFMKDSMNFHTIDMCHYFTRFQ